MKNVLWLASWYPSRVDPFNGDFIERHGKAASLYQKITVLYAVNDTTEGEEIKEYSPEFSAHILYYVGRGSATAQYLLAYRKLIRYYIRHHGKPDVVHVHVSFRAGLVALLLKWFYGIPFIVSEHWSLFNDAARPDFMSKPYLFRKLVAIIFKNASAITAVSKPLAASIREKFGVALPYVVPNVFDDTLFFQAALPQTKTFRFIHASQLNYAKNAAHILQAVALLNNQNVADFSLTIYGPRNAPDLRMIDELGIQDLVTIKGEVPQAELASDLRAHDAFILYSRYEGLPCVIIEAQAAGLPVIVSDIPSMHELVRDRLNGLIVAPRNPQELATAMLWMIKNRAAFDRSAIAKDAHARYSFPVVGKMISDLYSNY